MWWALGKENTALQEGPRVSMQGHCQEDRACPSQQGPLLTSRSRPLGPALGAGDLPVTMILVSVFSRGQAATAHPEAPILHHNGAELIKQVL